MRLEIGDVLKTSYNSGPYIITNIQRGRRGFFTSGSYTGKNPGYPLPVHMNITCKQFNGTGTPFYLNYYDEKTLKSVVPNCNDFLIPLPPVKPVQLTLF